MKVLKDWIISHKLLSIIIAAVMLVGATSAVVLPIALAHKHEFSAEWTYDAENHWHECTGEKCDETKDNAEHTFISKTNEKNHLQECSICGYKKDETAHSFTTNKDDNNHWQECSCGYKKDETAHSFTTNKADNNHWQECSCGYKKDETAHSFTTNKDDNNHWQECSCGYKKDETAHTFTTNKDDNNHWQECSCGYKKDETAHSFTTNKDDNNHWQECSCGYKKDEEGHYLTVAEVNVDNHVLGCSCGYRSGALEHTYETDDQTECDTCVHERTSTTLAFKTGACTMTYNGQAQAFDKANWVETNVSLDDVIVEYSTSKTDPDWTKDVPVNAGTYYIRLSVAANKDHTSCITDNIKELKINQKDVSLADLLLVYLASELNTSTNKMSLTLTSADIEGLCGTDTLQATLYKKSGKDVFKEGEEWNIVSTYKTDSNENTDVGIQASVSGNYRFDSETVGKLYIANATSYTGNSVQEKHESQSVHIAQNGVAYYSVNLNRSNRSGKAGAFATYYSFDFTNNVHVKVVDVITRSSGISVKITGSGSLLVYGEAYGANVLIGVKYEGTNSDGIDNKFKLVESVAEKTVADAESWKNALTFANGGYEVVLKKNGEIVEECKYVISSNTAKYYKKDSTGERYYSVTTGESYQYYIYEKNDAGEWIRRSLIGDYADDEANDNALSSIKLSEKWLKNLISAEAFETFAFSYEDLMYHTDVAYTLGDDIVTTDIALRFVAGNLYYAEFTDGVDNYTIVVKNSSNGVVISLPDYAGSSKEKAIAVPYSETDGKFSLENVTLSAGDNWFVIDITEELFDANKKTTTGKCEIDGTFTTESSATLTIAAESESSDAITNNKSSENGKLNFTGLSVAGKYYVKITVTEDCTGSFTIEFKTGKISM